MKIQYYLLTVVILISCSYQVRKTSALNNSRIKSLVYSLNKAEWEIVFKSKDSLEQLENEALPYLIENLNSENKYVKLINTADLIYPGTVEFFGSGWVVDYDIDWLAIRTGWVIEEITFENFGFKESIITEDTLMKIMKDSLKYQEYLKTGKYDFIVTPNKVRKLNDIIKRTNDWWSKNSSDWSRLKGITNALKSNDIQRQSNALQYLRHGDFCINGLTREYFEKELRPIVSQLLESEEDFIKEDAKMLLDMVDYSGNMEFYNITRRCWNKNNP